MIMDNKIKLCRMGENYAFIKPNGDVERCCKNHSNLGNIINGTFRLLEQSKECYISDCSCWRRMLVGKKGLSKYWEGMFDSFYRDKIKKLIEDLNSNFISFNEAYYKYIEFKQKIYDKNTRKACIGMWDQPYCKEIEKIILDLNEDIITLDNAYEKYTVLKQKIYDKNTKKYYVEKWDQICCDKIRKLIVKMNNNEKLFNEICEEYSVLKQKIYCKKTRKRELEVLENNIISNQLDWKELEKYNPNFIVTKRNQLLKYNSIFSTINRLNIFIYSINVYLKEGNLKVANKYFEKAKKMCEKIKNNVKRKEVEENMISGMLDLGWREINNKNLPEAEKIGELTMKVLNSCKYACDSKNYIYLYIYMSRLNIVLKHFENAKDYLLKIKKIDNDNPSMYKLLAMVEFELQNYNESKINFKNAIKFSKRRNDKKELFEIYDEIVVYIKRWCDINNLKNEKLNECENIISKLQKKH